ncbi:hypothetical protein LCGC14_2146040, partial [marine sediment metagenome]
MTTTKIEVAERELRRLVTSAVGRSFLKTLTEPITNSDSALKRQAGVPHGAGLVPLILGLKADDRVDTAALKASIPKRPKRKVTVQVFTASTAAQKARVCRILDHGPGMTAAKLKEYFGVYASAKAKGEQTRSLFGRGALDVLLYHQDSTIYSVSGGKLSVCRIHSDAPPRIDVDELGDATPSRLRKFGLPTDMKVSGTVVSFRLHRNTHIPQSAEMPGRVSSFYMLRLIAADPNTEIRIEQHRAAGIQSDRLQHDFPIGTVVGAFSDAVNLGKDGKLPVSILVARADTPLHDDPTNRERRDNGLLFVDENDAVLDLTLLPAYDGNPYLKHIYGLVQITGLRAVLEAKLEADEPVAVLTERRDGFDRKHDMVKLLFGLVEKHVKAIYEREEKRQRKGEGKRSQKLAKRIRDALKAINDFSSQETGEGGVADPPVPERDEAIYFSLDKTKLFTGRPKSVRAFVNF